MRLRNMKPPMNITNNKPANTGNHIRANTVPSILTYHITQINRQLIDDDDGYR
jgi:hypothetical protein